MCLTKKEKKTKQEQTNQKYLYITKSQDAIQLGKKNKNRFLKFNGYWFKSVFSKRLNRCCLTWYLNEERGSVLNSGGSSLQNCSPLAV